MKPDLLSEVVTGLSKRKGDWKQIASEIEGVSYSMIALLGRGKYQSSPTIGKLEKIAAWLRTHPMQKVAA